MEESQVWWQVLVIPAPKKQKQADPWGLLVTQLSIFGELQAKERSYLKKQGMCHPRNNGWGCLLTYTL